MTPPDPPRWLTDLLQLLEFVFGDWSTLLRVLLFLVVIGLIVLVALKIMGGGVAILSGSAATWAALRRATKNRSRRRP